VFIGEIPRDKYTFFTDDHGVLVALWSFGKRAGISSVAMADIAESDCDVLV